MLVSRAAEMRPETGREPRRSLKGVEGPGIGREGRKKETQDIWMKSRWRGGLEKDQSFGVGSGLVGDLPSLQKC